MSTRDDDGNLFSNEYCTMTKIPEYMTAKTDKSMPLKFCPKSYPTMTTAEGLKVPLNNALDCIIIKK